MNNLVLITGNTYPVKESLKALGGRWDAAAKGWRVPADKAGEARGIVARAPRKAFTARPGRSSYARRPGKWTGCSCGSREDSSGELIPSPRNCKSCEFDAYDC